MSICNIIEAIDSLLPQNLIDIRYVDMPEDGDLLLIEESGSEGQIDILEGFDGVVASNIQFFIRLKAKGDYYNKANKIVKSFYKKVYDEIGSTIGSITIENVGNFSITPLGRDKNDNFQLSLDFPIRYKEN